MYEGILFFINSWFFHKFDIGVLCLSYNSSEISYFFIYFFLAVMLDFNQQGWCIPQWLDADLYSNSLASRGTGYEGLTQRAKLVQDF